MQKGKSGLTFTFMASISFLIAYLGGITPALLVAGFAIAVEKNDWLTKQTIAALLLAVVDLVCSVVLGRLDVLILWIPVAGGIISSILHLAVFVPLLVFMIICMSRTAKGQDCRIPCLNNLANAAVGIGRPRPTVASVQPIASVQNPQNLQ